jgi:cytochrome P450
VGRSGKICHAQPNETVVPVPSPAERPGAGTAGLRGHALLLNLAGVTGAPLPSERFDDDYFQDPLAHFRALRETRPVAPVLLPGAGDRAWWMITGYEQARAALADPRLVKDPRKLRPDWEPHPDYGALHMHLLNLDPPDHTRLRRLVSKAFTPRRVAGLRPRVEQLTAALLDAAASRAESRDDGVIDLLDEFAFRLPVTVICELLGVPARDQDDFRGWSAVVVADRVDDPEERRTAATAMSGYFTTLLAAKRAEPGDDLLSALIAARDAGDALSERELTAMLFLLLVAGFETTVNLIASGTLALLSFPDQMARLRADPSLLPGAVEELLRFANPLNHATERFACADLPVGDVVIPAGEWVLAVTSSANRDPGRFPDPDRLDVGRDADGHLAFGHGIHYCLGAPLARLEGEVAIGSLLARFPALSLAVPPSQLRWRPSSLIHGLESLPVRLA